MQILKPVNFQRFLDALKILQDITGEQFKAQLVDGYTQVPEAYRESADWQTWHFAAAGLVESGIVDTVPLPEFWKALYESNAKFIFCHKSGNLADVLVLENPEVRVRRDPYKSYVLHDLSTYALKWKDTPPLYYADSMKIDPRIYEAPETLTGQDIVQMNLETRRIALLILGDKYFSILGSEPKTIDSGVDNQGNMMELLEFYDKTLEKNVRVLKVICPSTKRLYCLYPPNQKTTNVWEAKKSTFYGSTLTYRQGDVGLKLLNDDSGVTEVET